jgi:signal transduction histidine kinase
VFAAAALWVGALLMVRSSVSWLLAPVAGTAFALGATTGLILLGLSAWGLITRRGTAEGRAFVVLSALLSIVASAFPDLFGARTLTAAFVPATLGASAAIVELSSLFPRRSATAHRLRFIRWLGYIVALAVVLYSIVGPGGADPSNRALLASRAAHAFLILAASVCFIANLVNGFSLRSPVARAQAQIIATATMMAFLPSAVWLAGSSGAGWGFSPFVVPPLILLPLALAYTMRQFGVSATTHRLRRGLTYALVSAILLGAYALVVSGLSLIFGAALPAASPLWFGALALVLALTLEPVRRRVQSLADRTLFRNQQDVDGTLATFTNELGSAPDLRSIVRTVHEAANSVVQPAAVHVFLYDELNDQFGAFRSESGRASSDIRFAGHGSLAQYFSGHPLPLHIDEGELPAELQPERSKLALLATPLLLPLMGRDRPLGWIALGKPRSGKSYSMSNLVSLERLAHETSFALTRVQTVENLERRIQEMNALTRVAQGVNITLTFDDVLELIYAQTAQIVPLSDFHITLYRREGDYYYLAFALENNERIGSRENSPLPPQVDLSREVVRRGRPIITQDYESQCRTLGVSPIASGISAWMGVPLNAGAESIGALSVGSRDSGASYTPAQLELLHAVADQTAGAIVKARLLRETQQRASQLSTLNDVTRQLASIRELDALRRSVIDGATSILGCEAGIFYSVEQPGGDLAVRAVSGAIGLETVGTHVAPSVGNVASAVTARAPSIDNEMKSGSGAHVLDPANSAFEPVTSLAIPLLVQDTIVGVLEVMNRRDGGPFVPDDRSLLMAFAAQAAAALENVRLYTLTDQELAARVEELSVMQRIDRELNASLEMDRAMRITLEWALRQSGADAGVIGLLEGDRLRVVTEIGFGRALGDPKDQSVPMTLPGLLPAVETGLPQRVRFVAGQAGFLPASDHQVVIPIRREATVIGLLILESLNAIQEDVGFLSRLSDHAAIAISNAQLYDEVQRANVAKSDFVSLVAHELKNPMTSIKGYTELLATGAVGEVNEMQASFLNTIRSNTERMSTLVSDLNDNSKIEAGRLRLDFGSVQLAELLDEIIQSTRRQIDEKKQTVQSELPEHLPPVWCDRTRLGQILINLVSNANKYTPEGGLLLIGAEASANHWDPAGAGRVVHVWLRDNGIGISSEDQQKMFQKFFRSEDPKAREVPGAGLGLNITRSLVEMQGGRIWFESQHRQGTTFHFTIPVAETEQ